MTNEKVLLLCMAALEKTVKKLAIKVVELEKKEDDFKAENCVRLKDQNDDRMLGVENTVVMLTIEVTELEGEEDDFKVGNFRRLNIKMMIGC